MTRRPSESVVPGELFRGRRSGKLDNFDFLPLDDLGCLPQGNEESGVLFTQIA